MEKGRKRYFSINTLYAFLIVSFLSSGFANAQVKVDWNEAYHSTIGNGEEFAGAMTIDDDGNVFVAGASSSINGENKSNLIVIKYNSEGVEQWTSRVTGFSYYSPQDIKVDIYGNIYVASQAEGHFNLVKFREDGQPLYQRGANAIIGLAKSILLHYENDSGEDPNVIVTGWQLNNQSESYVYTVKYDNTGGLLWSKSYDAGNGFNEGNAIKLLSGNYIVVGSSSGGTSGTDYITIKYTRDGNEEWAKRYNGSAGLNDGARDVVTYDCSCGDLNLNRIAVTGFSRGTGGIDDMTTIFYDLNGNQLWDARYFDPNEGKGNSFGVSMAIDRNGRIVVMGRSTEDVATVSYDFNGNQIWAKRFNGAGNGSDYGLKVLKDFQNNYYSLIRSQGLETEEFAVIKYNYLGEEVWTRTYSGTDGAVPASIAVEKTSGRKVYVSGTTNSNSGDIATIVYADEGPDFINVQWPPNGEINIGDEFIVYAQAYLSEFSGNVSPNSYSNLYASIGVSVENTDPATWDESAWEMAPYNVAVGNNAEYFLNIAENLAPGKYYYASRFGIYYPTELGSAVSIFSYGGYSEGGGGFWDGITNVSGELTIKDPNDPNIATNSSFQNFVLGEKTFGPQASWNFNITLGDPPAEAVFEIVEDAQDDDSRSLKVTNGAFNGGSDFHIEAVVENLEVEEGIEYQGSIWLKADTDSRVARFYFGLPASGGWARYSETDVTLTTEWKKYAISHTASATDEENAMRFGTLLNYSENAGGVIQIDNLVIQDATNLVSNESELKPVAFKLSQNYPNPFNPSTSISFNLPVTSEVKLEVFNLIGNKVATLINETLNSGSHSANFDASNLSSGIYIYRIQAGDFTQTKKMLLIK